MRSLLSFSFRLPSHLPLALSIQPPQKRNPSCTDEEPGQAVQCHNGRDADRQPSTLSKYSILSLASSILACIFSAAFGSLSCIAFSYLASSFFSRLYMRSFSLRLLTRGLKKDASIVSNGFSQFTFNSLREGGEPGACGNVRLSPRNLLSRPCYSAIPSPLIWRRTPYGR